MSVPDAVSDHDGRGNAHKPVVIDVRNVRKSFGSFTALDGVSLRVHESEVVAIIGPSGSGKSTLARCIIQLEEIDGGAIFFEGELLGFERSRGGHLRAMRPSSIAVQRKRMGMVFQSFNLFPHITVLKNIIQPQMLVHGATAREAEERARHLLDRVGLADKASNYPITLSGGEQQRVAIARALAPNPRIMLFDEPTSALDPELVGEVTEVLRDLAAGERTMVVVTHDLSFARSAADWVVFMERGRIVEQGTPEEILTSPSTSRLQLFLSREKEAAAAQESSSAG
jgi:ABC-type polar amino acid transport system ATPase subunit